MPRRADAGSLSHQKKRFGVAENAGVINLLRKNDFQETGLIALCDG